MSIHIYIYIYILIVSDPKLSSSEGPSPHSSRALPQCRRAAEKFAGCFLNQGFLHKVLWVFARRSGNSYWDVLGFTRF